jgi:putative endonuclease
MYFVYGIHNTKHDKIYIGQTKDLPSRLGLHNNHTFKGYTSRFDGKWDLIYSEECNTREDALIREKQLKSYRGRQFIKSNIPG